MANSSVAYSWDRLKKNMKDSAKNCVTTVRPATQQVGQPSQRSYQPFMPQALGSSVAIKTRRLIAVPLFRYSCILNQCSAHFMYSGTEWKDASVPILSVRRIWRPIMGPKKMANLFLKSRKGFFEFFLMKMQCKK